MKVVCRYEKRGRFSKEKDEYTVYAMLMDDTQVFLLVGEDDLPEVLPFGSFEIVSHILPPNWFFRNISQEDQKIKHDTWKAIWGYKEIVFCREHYYDLVVLEPWATEIFCRRKEEFDYFEEFLVPSIESKCHDVDFVCKQKAYFVEGR